jgi:hypothetical protein
MTIHRFLSTVATVGILSATLATTTACATASPRGAVYVRVGPPLPVVERRIAAPGPGFVWLPGSYAWNGRAYLWRPGRWERPPRRNARWVPARWYHDRRRGWYIVEGHWR